MNKPFSREDIFKIFNQTRFQLHHYACGYYPLIKPHKSIKQENRIFFPLENPNRDKNYIEDNYRRYTLTPGKMYFVPAYTSSVWRLDEQLKFLSIHTSVEIIPGIELFSNCSGILELECPGVISSLLEIHQSDQNDLLLKSIIAGGLAYYIQIQILQQYKPSDFIDAMFLQKYIELSKYLSTQANAQTSVEDIAKMYGLSRVAFTRNFTKDTGLTPKKLIDRYTMKRCLDLIDKDLSFKEIAAMLQFSNEFTFSRFFKRLMGSSPRTWKKNHKKL